MKKRLQIISIMIDNFFIDIKSRLIDYKKMDLIIILYDIYHYSSFPETIPFSKQLKLKAVVSAIFLNAVSVKKA